MPNPAAISRNYKNCFAHVHIKSTAPVWRELHFTPFHLRCLRTLLLLLLALSVAILKTACYFVSHTTTLKCMTELTNNEAPTILFL